MSRSLDGFNLKPLEIFPHRGWNKFKFISMLLMGGLMLFASVSEIIEAEFGWGLAFIYITGYCMFSSLYQYKTLLVKGPVFSFSKHGFIDHRARSIKIYRWPDIDSITWTQHSSKGIPYKLLRINPSHFTWFQKIGKVFLHHPYELYEYHIADNGIPEDLGQLLQTAVPAGKLKTEL